MTARIRCALLATILLAGTAPLAAEGPELGDLGKVGEVDFPTSCSPQVHPEFLRGVALLHSFFYGEARRVFTALAEREPSCAMAHWGVAMTWFHPLWTPPSAAEIAAGLAAVERAEAAQAPTQRERDYIDAMAALYRAPKDDGDGILVQSCHGVALTTIRRSEYVEALERLHHAYPDDMEATAFYALSLVKPNPRPDQIDGQLAAAAILERLWAQQRDHPGVVHYLIHAYDYPSLAQRGLPAADHYTTIAPWVPHVLHMPSHIYTRLGMWEKSLAGNRAAADAARAYGERHHPGTTYFEELHALDYQVYAHLQRGEDAQAKGIVERILAVEATYPASDFAAAYAVGVVPARYALERHAWREAAAMPATAPHLVEEFPFDAAHVEFARAVGQVRTGDSESAKTTLARMRSLGEASTDPRAVYFRHQLELQQLAVQGLIAQAAGRSHEAIALLRYAADEDDTLGKHPVSPGSVYPTRELLGELLLELDRPADALRAFEQSLVLNPGRLRALDGARRAAEAAGEPDKARAYARQLLDQAGHGERPEVAAARTLLAGS